jgi:hypothetical protein
MAECIYYLISIHRRPCCWCGVFRLLSSSSSWITFRPTDRPTRRSIVHVRCNSSSCFVSLPPWLMLLLLRILLVVVVSSPCCGCDFFPSFFTRCHCGGCGSPAAAAAAVAACNGLDCSNRPKDCRRLPKRRIHLHHQPRGPVAD